MGTLSAYKAKFDKYIRNLQLGGVKLSKTKCAVEGLIDFVLFGSTITDYFELSFWKKKTKEKSQYATWRIHKRFIYEVDDRETIRRLTNKTTMYQHLSVFLRREQLYTQILKYDEFKLFCDKHPVFFFKPCENSCGEGIEKVSTKDKDSRRLFSRIKDEDAVIDTPVVQHEKMASLNENSVNTLRIFTFRNDGIIYFTGCALRIGTDSFVDNYSAGGLVCAVDLQIGRTKDKAENYLGQRFSHHPISHTKLVDFQVPKWDEVIKYVFNMAQVYELNYVAWDIAVQEDGVDLIEANPAGMINTIQIAGGGPKKSVILQLERKWRNRSDNEKHAFEMVLCQ